MAISKRRIKHSLVREFSSNEWSHPSGKGHNNEGINIYEFPPEPLSHFHPNKLSKGEGGSNFKMLPFGENEPGLKTNF